MTSLLPAQPELTKSMVATYLRRSAVVCAVTAVCVAWLDVPIARYFHDAWGGTPLFDVFRALTDLGQAGAYIVIALAIVLVCRAGARMRHVQAIAVRIQGYERAALCVLGSLAASGLVVNVLKPVFGRVRPRELFAGGDMGFLPFSFDFHHLNSFPSGHAQTIWAVFAVLMILFPRRRWWFAGVAVAVSASRVVIAAHFLGDVVAGAWIGVVGAVLACAIAESRGRIAGGPRGAGPAPVIRSRRVRRLTRRRRRP